MTFIKNSWYAAAESKELDQNILGRTICGEPIVFFRDSCQAPVALEDRCCHRHVPLSLGKRIEGRIQCGYHGLEFDSSGSCVLVPGQRKTPPQAQVQSFPVKERYRYIWIWLGDREKADDNLIPDYHWNEDPAWISNSGYFHVKGNHQLLVDNLLDLSHVQFVHASTLGAEGVTDSPLHARRKKNRVIIERWIMDKPPPPMFAEAVNFTNTVDRWQLITWTAPTHVVIDAGCAVANTGAREGDRSQGMTVFSNHTITPETETSCHYFWHHARNYKIKDTALTKFLGEAAAKAFSEDVVILAAQQQNLDRAPLNWNGIDINADTGVLQARKIVENILKNENSSI